MAQTAEIGALRVTLAMDVGEFSRGARAALSDLDRLAGRMSDFGDKMNRVGVMLSAALTAPLAALGGVAARTAAAFEKGMSNISTIVDTAAESMAAMSKEVMDVSKAVPVQLADLSAALYDIRSAGVSAGDAMGVLKNSARLAVSGLGTVQESADIATSAINAFGLQGAAVETLFDTLFKTTQFGKTTISGLAQGFGAVAGTVSNAGIKLDEYLASVAALTTTGLPAAQAHTQLRAAIAGLTRDSEIASKVFKTLGAENFKDLIEKSGGLVGAFEKINATLQGNDANLNKLLGSTEAYNALIGLTGKQNGIFNTTLDSMRSGVDQLGTAFDKQASTNAAKWQLLMNQFERVQIAVGTILLPAMQSIAGALEGVARAFEALSPETQRWVVLAAGIAVAIGPALAALGLLATGLAVLTPIIAGVAAAVAGFIATSGPLGLFVVMATALTTAWNIWGEDIVALFNRVTTTIGEKVGWMLEQLTALKDSLTSIWGGEAEAGAGAAAAALNETVTPAVQNLANAFANLELQGNLTSRMWEVSNAATAASVPITNLATEARKAHTDSLRLHNEAERERMRIIEEMRTPEEAMIARQEKLAQLFQGGARDAVTYGRAMAQASAFSSKNMDALASSVSSNLSAIFGETKAVAIATALINTYQGISRAIATYPPPISTAMAAVQAAAGFAQVAAIRSQTKSGGGGGGAAPDMGGAAAAAPGGPTQSLYVQGLDPNALFTGDAVRGLAGKLLDYQRDGGQVVLA